jgi:hypothetical protein
MESPDTLMKWSLAGFLLAVELTIIILVWVAAIGFRGWKGISLERLIAEHDGAASFSRFQFLIFTFVIASAYVVQAFASVQQGGNLPAIPAEVLGLIGLSGGTYLVSKGIEKGGEKPGETTGAEGRLGK